MKDLLVNVIDEYEGDEILGRGVTIREAVNIKAAREEDTDGECLVRCYSFYTHNDVTHIVEMYTQVDDVYKSLY